MGRLQAVRRCAVAVVAAALAVGCDHAEGSSGAPSSRSEAVTAASDMPVAAPSAPNSQGAQGAPSAHAGPATPRDLCASDLAQPGMRLAKAAFRSVAAAGGAPPPVVPAGGGKWTWVNLFASWCGPCKEEMPRLRGFEQRLTSNLEVAFVSLDDDDRLLKKYLEEQPASGAKSALWLQPGKGREAWLASLRLKDPPELPVHVLVDPSGKARCVVSGAIDDADFPRIASIVKPDAKR